MTKGTAVLRKQNEKRVLSLLRREGVTTRLDISRRLHISKNTVSLIIDKFIQQGIVRDIGTHEATSAGRPKINIELVPEALKAIGVYVQPDGAVIKVTDYGSNTIEDLHLTLAASDPKRCLQELGEHAAALAAKHPEAIGIGVGLPGIVDADRGFVHYSSGLGWNSISVSDILKNFVSLPLFVMNSVKASALAALQPWDAEQPESVFYIRIDEGVGGALLLRDKLHLGSSWTAGEVGHLTIDPQGPMCRCGRKGCLEALVRKDTVEQRIAILSALPEPKDRTSGVTPEEQAMLEAARHVSTALSHIIHLCNPKLIIVDSLYSQHPLFKEASARLTREQTLSFPGSQTEIFFANNRENPAAGAALAVIREFEAFEI